MYMHNEPEPNTKCVHAKRIAAYVKQRIYLETPCVTVSFANPINCIKTPYWFVAQYSQNV